MTPSERFRAVMNFQPFDRLPLVEWADWWDKTIDRWHGEGLAPSVTDRYDICDHFGLETYRHAWLQPYHRDMPEPPCHGAGIIADAGDYERLHHLMFVIRDEWPVDPELWTRWAKEQQDGRSVLWFAMDGFFWMPRTLLGIERHLYAFYDQADLMHRMNAELADWMIEIIDRICAFCTPDFMTFAEDMSYNHGPMLSKGLFDEFLLPYYSRVVPHLKKRGIMPLVDSDGDVSVAAAWFREAGIDGILPLERQAGVDIAALRETYPRMRWIGHFDKMVMNGGEAAIRAEFERLLPTAAGGGFIISCDHQTPPGVSYDDYRLYISLFREYADKAGRMSRNEPPEAL